MDFGVLTMNLNPVWVFVVLGIGLAVASATVTVVLFQRLAARLRVAPILVTLRHQHPASQGSDSSRGYTW
jgi:hypothetical protein